MRWLLPILLVLLVTDADAARRKPTPRPTPKPTLQATATPTPCPTPSPSPVPSPSPTPAPTGLCWLLLVGVEEHKGLIAALSLLGVAVQLGALLFVRKSANAALAAAETTQRLQRAFLIVQAALLLPKLSSAR